MTRNNLILLALVLSAFPGVSSFAPEALLAPKTQSRKSTSLFVAAAPRSNAPLEDDMNKDFFLSSEQVNAIMNFGTDEKQKVVNPFGFWCLAVSLITCPIWLMAMSAVDAVSKLNNEWDPLREVYDDTGKMWSKSWLTLTNSYPAVSGEVDLLSKDVKGPCLFVANHASWLDIPVLCTVADRPFKFIAKGELGKLPCIGHQLKGGNHILIDRDDRRSQLRSFKDAIAWLNKGVPVMAFPEGRRSDDGRLLEFKGGLFALAMKTGVPIVPITLSHTHAVMPSNSLFPVQPGAGKLHIHVHPPISPEGKTDKELDEQVRETFMSTLPRYQHPAKVPVKDVAETKVPVLSK